MEYGQIVATRGIAEEIERSALFAAEIATAFNGKPEPLKGNLSGWWSRHIDEVHRIVY